MMVQSPLLAATAIEHAYRQRCPAAVRGPSDRSVGTPWIIGLSMADFARRRLEAPAAKPVVERCVALTERFVLAARPGRPAVLRPRSAVSRTVA